MEIERKYLVLHLPGPLESYPCRILEQGYLNTSPVVRIRRDNDRYELTYKSAGLMSRQEKGCHIMPVFLPLTAWLHCHKFIPVVIFSLHNVAKGK